MAVISSWESNVPAVTRSEKINGASLVSPPKKMPEVRFEALNELHANWVAIIPYAFTRGHMPQVTFDHERQWWGERTDGSAEMIACAHRHNLKVLLKPHVWVMGDGWPGEYDLDTEEEWQEWEETYRGYILRYAEIADSLEVAMFAIGTEFRIPAAEREQYWRDLIAEVRNTYSGKVTYAANWDNYQKVKFWDALDYIGIDAYFPISSAVTPAISDLEESWTEEFEKLSGFGDKYSKPILFTEYGYQSLDRTAGNHWEIDKTHHLVNMEAQANAYQALFNKFWDQTWFAGGFFWKWHLKEGYGGPENPNFTPQGKLAEEVIRDHFKSFSR